MDRQATTISGPRVLGYVLLLGAGLLIWLLATALPSSADDATRLGGAVPQVGEVVADAAVLSAGQPGAGQPTSTATVPRDAKAAVAETVQKVVATGEQQLGTRPLIGAVAGGGRSAVGDVVRRLPPTGHDVQRLPEQAVETGVTADVVDVAQPVEAMSDSVQQAPVAVFSDQDSAPTSSRHQRSAKTVAVEGRDAAAAPRRALSTAVPTTRASSGAADLPVTARPDRSAATTDRAQAHPVTPSLLLYDADRGQTAAGPASGGTGAAGACDSCSLVLPATDGGAHATKAQHHAADGPGVLPAVSPD